VRRRSISMGRRARLSRPSRSLTWRVTTLHHTPSAP